METRTRGTARKTMDSGVKMMKDGDVTGALDVFKKALEESPTKEEEQAIYYNVACCFSLLAGAGLQADNDAAGRREQKEYNEQALIALDASAKAGFNDWAKVRHDVNLKQLRENEPRFKKLMAYHDPAAKVQKASGGDPKLAYLDTSEEVEKSEQGDDRPRFGQVPDHFWKFLGPNWLGGGYNADANAALGQERTTLAMRQKPDAAAGRGGPARATATMTRETRTRAAARETIDSGVKMMNDGDVTGALDVFKKALDESQTKEEEQAIYYNVACCYSKWAAAGLDPKNDAAGRREQKEYSEQALLALDASVQAGFKDWAKIREDPNLEQMRENTPKFKKFMEYHDPPKPAEKPSGGDPSLAYLDTTLDEDETPEKQERGNDFGAVFSPNWLGGGYNAAANAAIREKEEEQKKAQ
jgi:hypothetical protein